MKTFAQWPSGKRALFSEAVFHFAAQPRARQIYTAPHETFCVNAAGTRHQPRLEKTLAEPAKRPSGPGPRRETP